jgi:serine phosphatase RsbU (regulator of sigma subunit)
MEVLDKPGFKEHIFIAAADSTGHGVPGAMVSVVCSTALSRAVKEFNLIKPGEILDKTRELVMETFGKSDADVKDGMDISLVCILKTAGSGVQTVLWAGANNPLWYIKNGDMLSLAADKQPIGKTDNAKPFRTHELELAKGDVLYLFTDGYADQFGGPKGKKFKYKPLQDHLGKISLMEPEKQKEDLARTFNEWKGNLEQVDDVCVIGIRF